MRIADYKELRVNRLDYESAMEIFRLSRNWPTAEKFSLIDQIRRSSKSICLSIADYGGAFVSKLSDSDAEAAEIGVLREVTAFAASERQNVWPSFPVAAEAPRSPRS